MTHTTRVEAYEIVAENGLIWSHRNETFRSRDGDDGSGTTFSRFALGTQGSPKLCAELHLIGARREAERLNLGEVSIVDTSYGYDLED